MCKRLIRCAGLSKQKDIKSCSGMESSDSPVFSCSSADRYFPISALIGSPLNFNVWEKNTEKSKRGSDAVLSALIRVRLSLDRCGFITGLQYLPQVKHYCTI